MSKAIFLDRDGVINKVFFHKDVEILDSPYNIQQVHIIEGAFEAIAIFNRLGYKVLVVTNQPGAAKGKMDLARIEEVNQHIATLAIKSGAHIDQVYCCPHHPVGTPGGNVSLIRHCNCRKPATGLFLRGIEEYQIDVNTSFLVGDSISDIQAGKSMGLTSVLVGGLKCDAHRLYEAKGCLPESVFQNLIQFAHSLEQKEMNKGLISAKAVKTTSNTPLKPDCFRVKLFADGANVEDMQQLASLSYIKGLTTNPTLMAKAGVSNYEAFAKEVLTFVKDKPISFEVFSDDFDDMERQANKIAEWGDNVYVKIPVTNTKGLSSAALIKRLASNGIKLNITALLTLEQVHVVHDALVPETPAVVSVFAGRIADTGRDPIPIMVTAKAVLADQPKTELLWASPREVLNIIQADQSGCDIVTATHDILKKLIKLGYDLNAFSLDTVRMFYNDAQKAKYIL